MKQIKIRNKNYNCSNAIYYHIQGLESENRLFNMEIKGHEQSEFELSKRIDKAIECIEKSWNDKCTIPLEEVGYSTDNRWEIWKILKGSDKE